MAAINKAFLPDLLSFLLDRELSNASTYFNLLIVAKDGRAAAFLMFLSFPAALLIDFSAFL